MHAMEMVTRVLSPCLNQLHAKRARSVLRSVVGLLLFNTASVSSIARGLSGPTRYRHCLKSVDRLLSNAAIHQVREQIYQCLARHWLKDLEHVLIVVDWSDLTADQRWHLLRASVVLDGRALTLFEQVYGQSQLGSAKAHERFVKRLGAFLPRGCRPIVMSDAGFHAKWLRLIEAQGWYFVGRVRGRNQVYVCAAQCWMAAREVYAYAQAQTQDLGIGCYTRKRPTTVRLVLAQRPPQGRHQRTLKGEARRSRRSQKNARREREPWLLACSSALDHLSGEAIVQLYAQRMRIEQSFRDTKSTRLGLGLEQSRSRSAARLEMLLLIVHLALYVQRLVGELAKNTQMELQFMATRRADRREISVITLGRRILAATHLRALQLRPRHALQQLTQQVRFACAALTENAG